MEVATEEHNLQAVLERELHGFDNEGLDFKQLEQYLTSGDGDICFPDEVIPAIAYNSTGDGQVHPTIDHTNGNVNKIHPQSTGPCYGTHTKSASPQYISAHLPESPPDSGSEPYSPDNPENRMCSQNVLSSIPEISFSQPMRQPGITSFTNGNAYQDQHNIMPDYREPPRLNHSPNGHLSPRQQLGPAANPHGMQSNFSCSMNSQHDFPSKKRKYQPTPPGSINANNISPTVLSMLQNIKQEPDVIDFSDDYSTYDPTDNNSLFLDGPYQVIKWQTYQPTKWHVLLDHSYKEMPPISYRVDSDKGFNFSISDDAFVCQKKNHFQVTIHASASGTPGYVKSSDGIKKIDHSYLHFFGIKMESPNQTIKVEQSQSDRSKKPFYPVRMDVSAEQTSKITVGRLHFSETTANNMRKKGKPNPDQRYFMLVVALQAHCGDSKYLLAGHMSEKIIVRASNPGQFESDMDVQWQKGQMSDAIYHVGRIGVNTDRPEEALTVHGNLKMTGHLVQPSDQRAKQEIQEMDSKEQLQRVAQLRIYQYQYTDEFAEQAGIPSTDRFDTGVLAQELQEVLPDAVRETGDVMLPNGDVIDNFLVVNKDRIYMENLGAVKELCKLTDNLETRIDQLEKVNKKLTKIKRVDSVKSTGSGRSLSSTITSISLYSRGSSMPSSKPCKKNRHCHHHHKGKCYVPHGAAQENSLCSNRIIQIAIITLVLVMAFCLVAITTLYIMETRQDDSSSTNPIASTFTGGTTRPPDILTTNNVRQPSSSTPTAASVSPTKGGTEAASVRPSTVVMPPLSMCETEVCETSMCCREDTHGAQEDPGTKTKTTVKPGSKTKKVDTDNDTVPKIKPVKPTYRVVSTGKPAEVEPANKVEQPDISVHPQVVLADYPVGVESNEVPTGDYSNYRTARRRRSTENEYDLRAHAVVLTEYNATINSQYCADQACLSADSGNFSYYIQLSSSTPLLSTPIEFKVANYSKVYYCRSTDGADEEQKACSTKPNAMISQPPGVNNMYSLPVGYYRSSSYKFRISTLAHEADDVCMLPNSQATRQFTEYNFHFKIVCA